MSRILVTGAAGFIGSSLTDRLLERGDTVLGLDNFDDFYDPRIKRRNLEQAASSDRFRLLEGDLRRPDQLVEALDSFQPDTVVHLAAMAGVRPSIQRPALYQEVNVGGTLNLLEAMRQTGRHRLVYGSTSSVYGQSCEPPFREDEAADRPLSPYAATKRAGELLAYSYHHLHDFRVTCLRFFTVYGPRQRPEMAIHRFCRLLAAGQPVPMFGNGESTRDYTYVDDILDGVVKAVDHDEGYGTYNLGESQTTRLLDLVHLLARSLEVEPRIDQQGDQPGDVPTTCADIRRAREVLGYAPEVSLEEGVRRFVAWFREQPPCA